MSFDLSSALPELTPKAIAWAEEQSTNAVQAGRALTEPFLSIAQRVGVAFRSAFASSTFSAYRCHKIRYFNKPQ